MSDMSLIFQSVKSSRKGQNKVNVKFQATRDATGATAVRMRNKYVAGVTCFWGCGQQTRPTIVTQVFCKQEEDSDRYKAGKWQFCSPIVVSTKLCRVFLLFTLPIFTNHPFFLFQPVSMLTVFFCNTRVYNHWVGDYVSRVQLTDNSFV